MTLDRMDSRFGINFVAMGVVGTFAAVPVIALQDVLFLVTGAWPNLPVHREVLYQSFAALAAVFWAVHILVFRPGLPRFVSVVAAISFVSYVVQPHVHIHFHLLAALCGARILGLCTLLLLAGKYLVDRKTANSAN